VNSDAFKQAHSRPKAEAAGKPAQEGQQPQQGGHGVMLGAKLSVHDVIFTHPAQPV
jgi:heme oxygenase (staphylobilin-producing)